MGILKMIGLRTKRRKLVNALKWLEESNPNHPNITEMTNQLQQVNLEIDEENNKENDPDKTDENLG